VARVLWRRKLVCCAVAAVVLAAGAVYIVTRPKVYESSSSVALLPVSSNAAVLPNYPNLITSLIPTYVQLVSSPVLLNQAAAALPFRISGTQLANDVFAESLSNAAVITIVGESRDPVQAQQIAAAATTAFLARVHGNGVVIAQIYGRPTVPAQPASPRTKFTLAVVLVLAIILGLGAGLAWDRLSGPADAADQPAGPAAAPPVLGIVRSSGQGQAISSIRDGPGAADQDAWRSLRANFMHALLGQDIRSVTVLSPVPARSATVAASLAAAVAELGLAVTLVDVNLRDPGLHEVLKLDNERGLTSIVLDGAEPATLPRPVPGVTGLHVITAGRPLPADADQGALLRDQLPRIAAFSDLVIADGPSLGPGPGGGDAGRAAAATGGVVLVLPAGLVTGDQARRAVRDLEAAGARVLGTVLTGIGLDQDGSGSYRSAGTAAR
jgi:Mrp family chromosome partitioning ATPase/capsular polysaccharide biosynthesis protein